jgi:hypothetical protein
VATLPACQLADSAAGGLCIHTHTLILTAAAAAAGEVGIDDALVMQAQEEIFEMNNGCVCCSGNRSRLKAARRS